MTMKHAIAFSLTLTVVLAMPPRASAQFDLDLQATEIGTQLQEILNRITQYTAQLTQFTRLDCSAQGMAAGAQATPLNEAAVVCDSLNMLGAFADSYRQLLQAPTDLLNTAPPLPDWRNVLQEADTVTEADIRNVYPGSADAAVAVFQRRRDDADRSLEYAGARADAGADLVAVHQATTAALGRIGERIDTDPDTGGPNRSSAALTEGDALGSLAQIRTLISIGRSRALAATQDAAARFRQEELRRGYAARRLADRAALEAQWAGEQATIAAAADQRIQSMYGGFQIPAGLGGNSRP